MNVVPMPRGGSRRDPNVEGYSQLLEQTRRNYQQLIDRYSRMNDELLAQLRKATAEIARFKGAKAA